MEHHPQVRIHTCCNHDTDKSVSLGSSGMFLSRVLTLGFWKKLLLWSVIGLIVVTLFGFFGLPYLLKYVVETQLTKLLHRQTTVGEVQFNPFALTLRVKGFAMKDRNGTDPFV